MGGLIATRRQSPQASIVDDGREKTRDFRLCTYRFNEYRSRDDTIIRLLLNAREEIALTFLASVK